MSDLQRLHWPLSLLVPEESPNKRLTDGHVEEGTIGELGTGWSLELVPIESKARRAEQLEQGFSMLERGLPACKPPKWFPMALSSIDWGL